MLENNLWKSLPNNLLSINSSTAFFVLSLPWWWSKYFINFFPLVNQVLQRLLLLLLHLIIYINRDEIMSIDLEKKQTKSKNLWNFSTYIHEYTRVPIKLETLLFQIYMENLFKNLEKVGKTSAVGKWSDKVQLKDTKYHLDIPSMKHVLVK